MAATSSRIGIEEITCEARLDGSAPSGPAHRDRRWPGRRPRGCAVTAVSMSTCAAALLDQVAAALPHHPRPVLRVLELLDEAGDLLLVPAGA